MNDAARQAFDKAATTGFLADAPAPLLEAFRTIAIPVHLADGEILFEQGQAGDALYVVEMGTVEVSVVSREGRKLALDVFRKGDVFGEIALFDGGRRTATVTAMEPCTLRSVRRADLFAQVARQPDLASDLILLAGQRLRSVSRQLHEQVFLPMPARLARKLLHLTRHGALDGKLALSQAELADFIGASREAVSKTLGRWREEGIVTVGRSTITVEDRLALEAHAEIGFI
ncbi:Crp/Fnr family transcriptional regulator [Aestuariibius sp. 2305UL40-4]|uniref:Crp/Fnr family transcriptional regulator n=1 Tax=Aestuariibius violaceus TaxID=3234132 RepID=UPI00345E9254